jgi:hypothetical protein
MVAGVTVVFLLAVFAAAFYFLGGMGLVTGLLAGSPQPAAQSNTPPSASDQPPANTLPEGVDETFAKRMFVEQVESKVNIQKLAEGKVKSFSIRSAVTTGGGVTEVPVTVTFSDNSSGPGALGMLQKGGKWFLQSVARDANVVAEESGAHIAASAAMSVDEAVLNTMLEQQAANQDVISGIVDGTYTRFSCDRVTPGPNTASVEITLSGPKASMMSSTACSVTRPPMGGVLPSGAGAAWKSK